MRRYIVRFILSVLILSGAFVGFTHDKEKVHYYEIKAEQVNDFEEIDSGMNYSELDPQFKKALTETFRKNDHFLGEPETTIETENQIENESWRVVYIESVPVLVSVEYMGETLSDSSSLIVIIATFGLVIGSLLCLWSISEIRGERGD